MNTVSYELRDKNKVDFRNQTCYCVGTGRMGLALQREYFEQLKLVQDEIGFRYIRGHGLFSDDMAIYQQYKDEQGNLCSEYNFTYLDLVMDSYLELGIRPFLELGFMPAKMASGEQCIFYWKGNTTPPADYEEWKALVKATLEHLIERYGEDEVVNWPIEVWNEPNLPGFWKGADMQEYFRLFEESFQAVKAVHPRLRVGGPAICGVDDERWIREFLQFCKGRGIALDFVTRHHYASEMPDRVGHYSYVKLRSPEGFIESLQVTRDIVDSFEEYRGMEIHITEFNTSYDPKAPVHDTNFNAAFMASVLSRMGDMNESYSYWTFGDIFEEQGVPFTPFNGGFGMVANGQIPKPTFWAFQFYAQLQGTCILRAENAVVVKTEEGAYRGVAWNMDEEEMQASFSLDGAPGELCLLEKHVDEESCNPLKAWHDMGEPASLSERQKAFLRSAAQPRPKTSRLAAGDASFTLELGRNAVVYFELLPAPQKSDRGYSYERVMERR